MRIACAEFFAFLTREAANQRVGLLVCNDADVEFRAQYEQVWREERARVLATLIRLLGSFDAAEEAVQEAFAAALAAWPQHGIPLNPRAWLVSTGRNKAVDGMRRRAVAERHAGEASLLGGWVAAQEAVPATQHIVLEAEEDTVEDDRLRLIFTCCHPALAQEAQVALTLRTLGGLSTEAIARAYLKPVATIAQRLVRAKTKIREARIPYRVPRLAELRARLDAVLLVVYLIFNEGYGAAPDESERRALCAEAIRLARVLRELLPEEPEVLGLLALMLLQHARREARFSAEGEVVLLEDQDRSLWDRAAIDEGAALTTAALRGGVGVYGVQAAIAALHGHASTAAETDWPQIVALYDVLLRLQPTPVVALNRAVAVAMQQDAAAGLALVEQLQGLEDYWPYWGAKAQLLEWTGDTLAAAEAYERAQQLAEAASDAAHARFLLRKLQDLKQSAATHWVVEESR
jgi:RNA polymerase sigma-70 factor (ECF subfamily)